MGVFLHFDANSFGYLLKFRSKFCIIFSNQILWSLLKWVRLSELLGGPFISRMRCNTNMFSSNQYR